VRAPVGPGHRQGAGAPGARPLGHAAAGGVATIRATKEVRSHGEDKERGKIKGILVFFIRFVHYEGLFCQTEYQNGSGFFIRFVHYEGLFVELKAKKRLH
jgi:hypothetical protein